MEVELIPFPADYRVIICNTGVLAQKAAGARDIFNQRVAAYQIGLMLIKERFPHFAHRLSRFRDLNAANLGVDEATIYELLLSLPQTITRQELAVALPDQHDRLQWLYGPGQRYPPVRRVSVLETLEDSLILFGGINCFMGARGMGYSLPLNDLWYCDFGSGLREAI